jgi:hypothetical protein
METPAEIRERWAYLRDLLIDQLSRFESGALRMTTGDEDVSVGAIAKLKRNIQDFDELIARSDARHGPPAE